MFTENACGTAYNSGTGDTWTSTDGTDKCAVLGASSSYNKWATVVATLTEIALVDPAAAAAAAATTTGARALAASGLAAMTALYV